MHFIIVLSIFFLAGCHNHIHNHMTVDEKIQTFMNYQDELHRKISKGEYSYEEVNLKLKKKYTELFSNKKFNFSKYNSDTLKKLSGVYYIMSFHDLQKRYLYQSKNIFEEIENRNLAKEKCTGYSCVEELFGLCIKFGEFSEAKKLKEKYPDILQSEPVFDVYEDKSILQKKHKLYEVSSDGKSLTLTSVQMGIEPKILAILSPVCHFSNLAMDSILSEPDLKEIFKKHSLIIFPINTSLSPITKIVKWNNENPELKYYIHSGKEYLRKDWKDFDSTGTPKFYFLKDNKIIYQIDGWGPTEKEFKSDFRKGIEQIGLSQ